MIRIIIDIDIVLALVAAGVIIHICHVYRRDRPASVPPEQDTKTVRRLPALTR